MDHTVLPAINTTPAYKEHVVVVVDDDDDDDDYYYYYYYYPDCGGQYFPSIPSDDL